ncbi:uncharacterized protein RCC_06121 [Ramularia collo-cygni]|uniref:Uncharacterized protein n=1 Tax=Ramularia collo-cygni TaxID=112498 RepID=A0A2D3VHM7_9PEZI|nr:uncharacterized protein RCC_06121 [Ramularia collo-cygni]CZT20263.1 uncharacterized protein RCC_06121 [Ramularia collo-cygni]
MAHTSSAKASEVTPPSNMATTTSAQASEVLDSHIQSLCQELQDMIFECVLDAQIPDTARITCALKPPTALQLNREIREKFARRYYGHTTFELKLGRGYRRQHLSWLNERSAQHQRMILNLQIAHDGEWHPCLNFDFAQHKILARAIHEHWSSRLGPLAGWNMDQVQLVVVISTLGGQMVRFPAGTLIEE